MKSAFFREVGISFTLVSLVCSAIACKTAPPKPARIQSLLELRPSSRLVRLKSGEGELISPSQLGYFLYDPDSKEVLQGHRENEFFIPASTTKIPTTLAALHVLGVNYRFKTYLAYRGKVEGHTLKGDLYLKGTGDPALKTPHLMDLAQKLAKFGIREVSGHFYYDESALIPQETIEEGREPWASFNSGVSALSHEFNQFATYWKPTQDPSVQAIFSVPYFPQLRFGLVNHTLTQQTQFIFHQDGGYEQWLLSPDSTQGGKSRLPLRKAGLATATVFADLCRMNQVVLPTPESGLLTSRSQIIAVHESPPLIEIVEGVLEYSNNMMAELLSMATARKLAKRPVGVLESAKLVQNWIRHEMKQSQKASSHFINGSGLTSKNRVTPKQLASFLEFADRSNFGGRSYETLLAVSGKKGDMEGRFIDPGFAFRVWAKTGSMDFTNSIAGFLHTSQGRRLIFAVMATDFKERELLEQNPEPASQEVLNRARKWAQTARRTQDELIMEWISEY